MSKRIIIVGQGFVGSSFEKCLNDYVDRKIVDPKLNAKLEDYISFKPHFIFICVPTPCKPNGQIDASILKKVSKQCVALFPKSILIIKSTCLPKDLKDLRNLSKNIIHNPEFLTENNAEEDMINATFQIFGGDRELCISVSNFLKDFTKCKFTESHYVSIEVASLIKYTINNFLALKVIFFNQLKELFLKLGIENEYDDFVNGVILDTRIGNSHMKVPGPDGRLGFGGACFPKDTKAFIKFFNENESQLSIIEEVVSVNNKIRKKYSQMLDREIDQNINFE